MIVTLKDGSKKEYAEAKSVIDIAYDISEGLARAACAGEVNGEVVDLRTVIDSDCELNILTAKDEKGLAVLRHTTSHILAQAVQNLFPDAKIAIGPSIDKRSSKKALRLNASQNQEKMPSHTSRRKMNHTR